MISKKLIFDISTTDIVSASKRSLSTDMDSETILLSIDTGVYGVLDEVGGQIFKFIAQPISVSDLCIKLSEKYHGDPTTIENDVLAFLHAMLEKRMIEVYSE